VKFQGNHKETAQLLGISAEALRKAVRDRGCPVVAQSGKGVDAVYDWPSVVAWRVRDVTGKRLDLAAERARLARAQAIRAESENAHRAGDLVSLALVERVVGGSMIVFRDRALGIPSKLAPELAGLTIPEIKAAIDRELRELLDFVANFDFAKHHASESKR
jgi:phage terminase Nu1 subunit (DNA packaging protein)